MKRPALIVPFAIAASCIFAPAISQESDADPRVDGQQEEQQGEHEMMTVYRQVMPDGRVVDSDRVQKGGKLEKITIEAPIEGNLWTTKDSNGPSVVPQIDPTPVIPVNSIPPVGQQKTVDEATSDVIRAEMLLEDARARWRANARTGDRDRLARDVAEAELALRHAVSLRDALSRNR